VRGIDPRVSPLVRNWWMRESHLEIQDQEREAGRENATHTTRGRRVVQFPSSLVLYSNTAHFWTLRSQPDQSNGTAQNSQPGTRRPSVTQRRAPAIHRQPEPVTEEESHRRSARPRV